MIGNTEEVTQNGKSIETGNACHTRKRIQTKQKQAKNEHNVRWTALSASKHK
jgi:methionine-rich copper-binding protein CopC